MPGYRWLKVPFTYAEEARLNEAARAHGVPVDTYVRNLVVPMINPGPRQRESDLSS